MPFPQQVADNETGQAMLSCRSVNQDQIKMAAKPLSDFISHVREAFEDYRAEVETSNLAPASKDTYLRHAETFVRWIEGDFEPGAQVSRDRGGNAQ